MSPAGRSRDGKPATSDSARPGDDSPAKPEVTHGHNGHSSGATAEAKTATAVATPDTDAEPATGEPAAAEPAAAAAPVAPDKAAPEAEPGKKRKKAKSGAQKTGTEKTGTEKTGTEQKKSGTAKKRGPVRRTFAAIGGFFARISRPNWVRHVILLVLYMGAGIGVTWPRFTYLISGSLPRTTDVASFVWGMWWVAHQVTHLGDPFFTHYMAAPVGIQLGFSTLMPLAGLVMTPVTLLFGPSAGFTVLSLIVPGLLCYAMFRAARLWLNVPGSIAAGAFFGLSTMMLWQNWYHVNIAAGLIFLPLTIEGAVRLRRTQKIGPAIWLGIALGAAVMTSQEGAAIALLLAFVILVPWVIGKAFRDRVALRKALIPLAVGAVVAFVVASPQLIAMGQQIAAGGAKVPVGPLAQNYTQFGVPLSTLFSASPRLSYYGLGHVIGSTYAFNAAPQGGASVQPGEGIPTFGLVVTGLAVLGVIIGWRKKTTWWFLLLFLGCAILALGTSLVIGSDCVVNVTAPGKLYGKACQQYMPFASHIHYVLVKHDGLTDWYKVHVSNLMPYTWLVRIPGLAGLREADRFALVGLVGAALLAGLVVQWLSQRRRWLAIPLLVIVTALSVLEIGWSGGTTGPPHTPTETMPTTMPGLDSRLQADHSNSTVLDVPFGLRGGLALTGSGISERAMLLATADGHPRSISYTAWVPQPTIKQISDHPFYKYLMKYQGATSLPTVKELRAAAKDLKTLNIGWAIEWTNLWRLNHPGQRLLKLEIYLRWLGFRRVTLGCMVPSPHFTICDNRSLERVILLKYRPRDAFHGN
ncbi:MAG TPA: hypothetical protein VN767_00005, partial [Streptosporangiaceae bacterium]|nr:hypothetical protein [Streptosporangiaceae bacterium]